jgi:hypothetical protein
VSAAGVAAILDLEDLALDRGGYLLLRRALRALGRDQRLEVRGRDPALPVHLRAFCRAAGAEVEWPQSSSPSSSSSPAIAYVAGGVFGRERGAERAGGVDPAAPGAVVDRPSAAWGLAPRGALVEAGVPPLDFPLAHKDAVWSDDAARLYAQAAAAQWDPATAIPWHADIDHPPEVEDAVVQVMTYLIENETAALLVPARFLACVHPHFREVMQLLAVQAADEARHIEVFTRRARLRRPTLGLSTVGGQASLRTLLEEPDFAEALFLLSVLGEGTFLALLRFLHQHAPDRVTAETVRLAAQDEARHVAFGLAHLQRHVGRDAGLRARLARAVERRHQALRHTAGLNEEVHDALVIMAARSWEPARLAQGHDRVLALHAAMDEARRQRLGRLGFTAGEAEALSDLHTRNFM